MKVSIRPSRASGTVKAPPSKSMAHRMLICAGLSEGESRISGISLSNDIKATAGCLASLGAEVLIKDGTALVKGTGDRLKGGLLECGESGSTLRFMLPVCLLSGKQSLLKGTDRLMERPVEIYEDICLRQGICFSKNKNGITVRGRLESGEYRVRGDVSSQFISGLLFALPLLNGESRIVMIPPVESRPYIDMTLEALGMFGISVSKSRENILVIKGSQKYSPVSAEVEGDCSNAAFLEAFNLAGGSVSVTGLREGTLQGDRVYGEYFRRISQGFCEMDISDCPDLGPVLMSAGALKRGVRLTGTRRLRIKESDRGAAMKEEVGKFGIAVEDDENSITVYGGELRHPETALSSHNDHRIAMALAVILSVTGGEIEGAEAVKKSFPDFFMKIRSLGIEVDGYAVD